MTRDCRSGYWSKAPSDRDGRLPGFMTALEVYDLVTTGGGNDFARVVRVCEAVGPYCLIGGLAVNCYVEPVFTVDADFVMSRPSEGLAESLNAQSPASALRIQFTTDPRYESFPSRAEPRTVLGVRVQVACLPDIAQGKIWAYSDPARRLSKRKKDELDLIRLAEAYPELKRGYPPELVSMLE